MNDDGIYLAGIESDVMAEFRAKSKNVLYRTDPEAWLWDVLGYRWHKGQQKIVHDFMGNRRTAVKSSNGVGKSRMVNEIATWGIAVHEPGELLIISTGPGLRQISETAFAYMASNIGRAKERGFILPGRMTDARWSYSPDGNSKSKTLVIGAKPSDRDIVSTFQGIRAISDKGVKTWVFIDEAGGVHPDLFVGAEAVTTGAGDNKIWCNGNPDNLGTYFHKIFTDPKISQDWTTTTIAAHELPTFTGEIVYPDDPEMQHLMLTSGMVDRDWVEQKKRAWGEDSARYKSKVLGEFPDSDDRSFFSQTAITNANETTILEDNQQPLTLGLDLARFGEDDSMLYANRGGRIRNVDSWSKATANESATRAHQQALELSADILVIDAAGLGGPIVDQIKARADRYYTVIATLGAERSPDPTRWANARAYWYDMLREGMLNGTIDLDYKQINAHGYDIGKQLYDELMVVQYDFTPKGAIKIESKKDMASRGVKSPDALDAVVYSIISTIIPLDDPLEGFKPGDKVTFDMDDDFSMLAGMPI